MPHVIETATSGRATCRGCGSRIASGILRFGERLPNPYADDGGEMTQWFHLDCGAYRRPEPFLEAVVGAEGPIPDGDRLIQEAQSGITHRRLPRVSAAGRAPTGRATCRACKTLIDKGTWRLALVFYEDGRFAPSGFIHARCSAAYLETTAVMDRIRHFTPGLEDADIEDLRAALTV